ncbi:S8 family serine peptidase [Peribacillus frigoritolerans]|uniref:S8 family serine peptidase n=1 Tax=Peribacillus frigoritolerans TaxID=450367 RepID=UPI003334F1EE
MYGHGTPIASIIAAKENEETVQGINPLVEVNGVKVIDDEGRDKMLSIESNPKNQVYLGLLD